MQWPQPSDANGHKQAMPPTHEPTQQRSCAMRTRSDHARSVHARSVHSTRSAHACSALACSAHGRSAHSCPAQWWLRRWWRLEATAAVEKAAAEKAAAAEAKAGLRRRGLRTTRRPERRRSRRRRGWRSACTRRIELEPVLRCSAGCDQEALTLRVAWAHVRHLQPACTAQLLRVCAEAGRRALSAGASQVGQHGVAGAHKMPK